MAIDEKDVFFEIRKDADRKRLFCSNLSTLLSMIVARLIRCLLYGKNKSNLSRLM